MVRRILYALTVMALTLGSGACAHSRGASRAGGEPRVRIDAQGVIRVDAEPVGLDGLTAALRRARLAPDRTLVVRYQDETGKRMIPEVTALLRQAGYHKVLFASERRASATVAE